jgi:7-cyano-7-deazaguanine synthase
MLTAVLLSGGLDSAVLLVEEGARHDVQPLYVSVGLAWEAAEHEMISRFLTQTSANASIRPLVSLSIDMRDVYPTTHWAIQGKPPEYHTPDEDVYLPGRNIVLLGKAALYCAGAKIPRLLLGTLAHNPFPDASSEFRSALSRALSIGLAFPIEIDAPYANTSKADVIRRGAAHGVPFELTLSCMNPRYIGNRQSGLPLHCGECSKCRERHDAFIQAGVADPTTYVNTTYVLGKDR